jgi:hypothetical protein
MARTSFITAAAIAGVALAGSAAIVANVGILNAAESTEIGTLSAAGDLLPADPQVVDVYLDDPSATTTVTGAAATAAASPAGAPAAANGAAASSSAGAAPAGATAAAPAAATASGPAANSGPNASSQTFAVADAGTVTISRSSGGLQLGDVVANPGWSSRPVRVDSSTVVVSFTNGARTLEFTATPGPDGSITGSIADKTVTATPTPTAGPATTVAPYHEDDEDDDDEHEYEAPEYEGGEDDD